MSASEITSIEKQKKDADRYNVFINNEFSFGIYSDSLVKFGLRKGDTLSELQIENIKSYDEINFAKKVSIRFLGYKPRTTANVKKKLKSLKISDGSISEVIDWLTSLKYLNDDVYSKQFIESKLRYKPMGKRLLKFKLTDTGIDRELIDKNIEEMYSEESEFENALKLLNKYVPKIKKGDNFEKKKKSFQYLVSRGFNLTLAKKAVDQYFSSD
ncbi:MAG TPA: RecX family transcriptional regulator [Ignavibacteria bacterium]|nr:RecX family transcriptional regulator [Ignavibacteria bacterium]